jgi:hypothetical protein
MVYFVSMEHGCTVHRRLRAEAASAAALGREALLTPGRHGARTRRVFSVLAALRLCSGLESGLKSPFYPWNPQNPWFNSSILRRLRLIAENQHKHLSMNNLYQKNKASPDRANCA